jgi:hypothetical protein
VNETFWPFWRAQGWAALAGIAVAAAGLLLAGSGSLPWLAVGGALAAAAGLLTGTWVLARHGGSTTRLLPALLTGMLARLLLVAAAAVPLILAGQAAFWSYVAGLAAALLPMQLHEIRVLRARAVPA